VNVAEAQFVLDIAAQLTGEDATVAKLNELAAELSGAGKGAAAFQDAIRVASDALTSAKAASAAAAVALAEGNAEYALLEKAALQAAKAAERAALKNKGVVPDDLQAKADAAANAVNAYARKVALKMRRARRLKRSESSRSNSRMWTS
jgi:hypothetical protein